ncbi:MAG TPA: hypothetical protein VFA07_05890 [Chthonomonadaceae bacterium]|nr:hypothetical protein [Chthonomonadaceae bacterium]
MRPALLLLILCLCGLGRPAAAAPYKVTAPPKSLVRKLGLSPFYKKYLDDRGFPILASDNVSDYALREAAYLIDQMLAGRDDIRRALIRNKVRFVVMAPTEMTTTIPEYSDLTPARYWDRRARGLGATPERPVVSCGEENLLGYPGDPYKGENILIHEFSHAIHEMGLRFLDPTFDQRLRTAYADAMQKGLWKGTYSAVNPAEYWAEGVQDWFDCGHPPVKGVHNDVATREQLVAYDPELAGLIASVFPNKTWRYQTPEQRGYADHLQGYDPAKAPHFQWDPALQAWYKEYQARQEKR